MLGTSLVNSSDAFKALVAATSEIIAMAKNKYVIFSLYINLTNSVSLPRSAT